MRCAYKLCQNTAHPDISPKAPAPFLGKYYVFCGEKCLNTYKQNIELMTKEKESECVICGCDPCICGGIAYGKNNN